MLFTAAVAAFTLGAAQAANADWTDAGNNVTTADKTSTFKNGCGSIVLKLVIPENATANRANLFIAQADSFNGSGIRIADANNGGSAGLSIGVVRANASSTWATSSMEGGVAKRVTLEAGQTYIVSLVYQLDEATGQTLQFCYVNNELIFSDSTIVVGSSGGGSKLPDVNIPEGFHDFPEKNFYSIDAVSGYDEALTAEDIAALVAAQRTNSTESVTKPTALALLALGVAGVALRRRVA